MLSGNPLSCGFPKAISDEMTKQSKSRLLQAVTPLASRDEEPYRQRRAKHIVLLVAAAFFIAAYLDWRWIFFLNLPVGLIGIGLALALIGRERATAPQRINLVGFLLCGGACIALTYGLELLRRPQPPSMALMIERQIERPMLMPSGLVV
jgi:hypothetical protein